MADISLDNIHKAAEQVFDARFGGMFKGKTREQVRQEFASKVVSSAQEIAAEELLRRHDENIPVIRYTDPCGLKNSKEFMELIEKCIKQGQKIPAIKIIREYLSYVGGNYRGMLPSGEVGAFVRARYILPVKDGRIGAEVTFPFNG